MFDIAYENEDTITAAELIKEFLWQKILKSDLSKPFAGNIDCIEFKDNKRVTPRTFDKRRFKNE